MRSSAGENFFAAALVFPDVSEIQGKRRTARDSLLARRAAAGEIPAWEEVVRLYGPPIYNLALSFARDEAEAEDLTQEIFLKLYRRLDRYRGEVPLVAWTLRLSRNLCIEQYRRRRRERSSIHLPAEALEEIPGEDDPRARVLHRQRLALVYRALDEMDEEPALVVLLRDLQGLSYEEVAAVLEIPLGTLKSRLVRGRRELARRIAHRLPSTAEVPPPRPEVEPC